MSSFIVNISFSRVNFSSLTRPSSISRSPTRFLSADSLDSRSWNWPSLTSRSLTRPLSAASSASRSQSRPRSAASSVSRPLTRPSFTSRSLTRPRSSDSCKRSSSTVCWRSPLSLKYQKNYYWALKFRENITLTESRAVDVKNPHNSSFINTVLPLQASLYSVQTSICNSKLPRGNSFSILWWLRWGYRGNGHRMLPFSRQLLLNSKLLHKIQRAS